MKTKSSHILILVVLFFYTSVSVLAQQDYIRRIEIKTYNISKQDSVTTIEMRISLDKLEFGKRDLMTITPVITTTRSGETFVLPEIEIIGNKRYYTLQRPFEWPDKPILKSKADYRIVLKKGEKKSFVYNESIPYKPWHQHASLWLRTKTTGNAERDLGNYDMQFIERIFPESYKPNYSVTYIIPESENTKLRKRSFKTNIAFVPGSYVLAPNFGNNANELEKIINTIQDIQTDINLSLNSIEINAYTSPEGNFTSNLTISRNRANALGSYIRNKLTLNPEQIRVNGHGEDWDGLKTAIKESFLYNKNEIIAVIDKESNPDARDSRLMAIDNRQTYNLLVSGLYPALNRIEYRIEFTVREFNTQEAREIAQTMPELLSSNEMFLVAQTYPKGSLAYNELISKALQQNSDVSTSKINAAAIDLEAGNADAAFNKLIDIRDNPGAWNNLAIAMAMKGMHTEAMELFGKAIREGNANAVANLEELQKMMETM